MDNGIHLSFTLLVVVFTAISVVSIRWEEKPIWIPSQIPEFHKFL